MRTLKKTLALVLCLAMIAGLCCFGTSAAFADAADIEYTEAVDVMNAIGVLKGDGTNFNPKGILTRAEAAVIIAKMLGEGDMKATSTFKDMAGYEWAQNYAAYCENAGLILGDGAGNFMPGQTLTGYQFGLMLARALGYKPAEEGVNPASYEIGTAALMKKIGLSKAIVNFDGTVGLTREKAAALALQALKSDLVYYEGGSTVTINGAVISTGAELKKYEDAGLASKGNIDATGDVIQFAEEYFPKLSISTTDDEDAYGRPATVWNLVGAPAAIARGAMAPVKVVTAVTKLADVKKELAAAGYTVAASVSRNVNGATYTDFASRAFDTQWANWNKNGWVVEMYDTTADKEIDTVVLFQPVFAQVTVTKTAESKLRGAYTSYTVAGVDGDNANRDYTTVVNPEADIDQVVVTGEVADKDMVLAYVNADGITHIEAVDTITGTITALNNLGLYTVDGATKGLAGAATVAGTAPSVNSKLAQTLYVDSYGYILGSKTPFVATNYAFVIKVAEYNTLVDGKVIPSWSATVARPDGSVETLAINEASYNDFAALTGMATAAAGFGGTPAVTFADINRDGLYELTALDVSDAEDKVVYNELTAITTKAVDLTHSTGSSVVYANAATKFIVADYAVNKDLVREATGTVTVYTGIANVPTYAYDAYAIDTDVIADGIANVVYVLEDTTATVSGDYIYLVGTYTDTDTVRVWDTLVNGAPSTFTTSKSVGLGDSITSTTLIKQTLYEKIVLDTDSKVLTGSGNTEAATLNDDSVQNKGGLLFINGSYVSNSVCADSVPVYTFDKFDDTVSVKTFADITAPIALTNSICYTVALDGITVTAIYIVTTTT